MSEYHSRVDQTSARPIEAPDQTSFVVGNVLREPRAVRPPVVKAAAILGFVHAGLSLLGGLVGFQGAGELADLGIRRSSLGLTSPSSGSWPSRWPVC